MTFLACLIQLCFENKTEFILYLKIILFPREISILQQESSCFDIIFYVALYLFFKKNLLWMIHFIRKIRKRPCLAILLFLSTHQREISLSLLIDVFFSSKKQWGLEKLYCCSKFRKLSKTAFPMLWIFLEQSF